MRAAASGGVAATPFAVATGEATTLATTETHSEVGVVLEAPPDGFTPGVSVTDAELSARMQVPYASDLTPSDVTSRLASVTDEGAGFLGMPVWVFTYIGVCVPPGGPPDNPARDEPCESRNSTWTVIIDAKTGAFLEAFTDG